MISKLNQDFIQEKGNYMIKKVLVKKIIQRTEFYAPRIVANDDTFAAIPKELLDEIQINDEVMVFSSDYLSYGGFSALVIKTPTKTLYDK